LAYAYDTAHTYNIILQYPKSKQQQQKPTVYVISKLLVQGTYISYKLVSTPSSSPVHSSYWAFVETTSITVLLRHYKRSSRRHKRRRHRHSSGRSV